MDEQPIPLYQINVSYGNNWYISFRGNVPQTLECYFRKHIKDNLSWMINSCLSASDVHRRINSCMEQELYRLVNCGYLKHDAWHLTNYDWIFLRE